MPTSLEAPIVRVTVYTDSARVVRRGRVTLAAGETSVVLDGLPAAFRPDSVRVAVEATIGVRLGGVDVATTQAPAGGGRALDDAIAELDRLRDEDGELADEVAVVDERLAFLTRLARSGAKELAKAVAAGDADPAAADGLTAGLAERSAAARAELRSLGRRRRDLARRLAAAESEVDRLRGDVPVERRSVTVVLDAEAAGEADVEVSYVVAGAYWTPAYDATVEGDRLTLTYHGLVRQQTGEDWPVVQLALSTARPAVSTVIPELPPWYVDEDRPMMPAPPMVFAAAAAAPAPGEPTMQPLRAHTEVAQVDRSGAAATYTVLRPVAVAADGAPHKAVIGVVDLDADLDYMTVPRIAQEAYLRATVTNSSELTLLPGAISVYQGSEFAGTSAMELTPPGGEVELQLGVDDRIVVERELVKRGAGRALLSGGRTSAAYRTTVTSHLPSAAKVRVVDGYPVSLNSEIKVKIDTLSPEPAERTDLGVCTWDLTVKPDASVTVDIAVTLEHPRGMRVRL